MKEKPLLLIDLWNTQGHKRIDSAALEEIALHYSATRKNFTISGKLNISGADFSNNDIRGVDLARFEISDSLWNNSIVDTKQFAYILQYAKQHKLDFSGINLQFVDFSELDLAGADFSKVSFAGVRLHRNNLVSLFHQIKKGQILLDGVILEGEDLSGKHFIDPETGVDGFIFFSLANLSLKHAVLKNTNLSGAILDNADFEDSNLQHSIIESSLCRKAKFKNANLTEAHLRHSDFSNSSFENANLQMAII